MKNNYAILWNTNTENEILKYNIDSTLKDLKQYIKNVKEKNPSYILKRVELITEIDIGEFE